MIGSLTQVFFNVKHRAYIHSGMICTFRRRRFYLIKKSPKTSLDRKLIFFFSLSRETNFSVFAVWVLKAKECYALARSSVNKKCVTFFFFTSTKYPTGFTCTQCFTRDWAKMKYVMKLPSWKLYCSFFICLYPVLLLTKIKTAKREHFFKLKMKETKTMH